MRLRSGSCPAVDNGFNVNIDGQPAISNAGPDIAQCGTGDFTMAANNPIVGTGTWTLVGGAIVAIEAPNDPTTEVTGLPAGQSATLQWTIANGTCPNTSDQIIITNNEIPQITAASANDPVICGGNGLIELTFSSSVPDGNYNIVHDAGTFPGVTVSGGSANINAPEGQYDNLRITVSGCTSTQDIDITLTDPAIPTIAINGFASPTTCGGTNGSISFDFTGIPDGIYNIDYDGGSFNNVSIIGNTAVINNLSSGTYDNISITVNSCISAEFPDVTLNDPATPTVTLVGSTHPTACGLTDGTITLSFTGIADGIYDIDYENGVFFGQEITFGQTIIQNLGEDTYNDISITKFGCKSLENIDVALSTPPPPVLDGIANQVSCNTYTLPSISGSNLSGSEAYYDETGGGGTQYLPGDEVTSTKTLYIFSPGTGNCPDVESSFTITINTLSVSVISTAESCVGEADGSINVTINNGTGPFNIQLNSGASQVFPNNVFALENLGAGNYLLDITDADGCQTTSSIEVMAGPNLEASVTPITSCNSGSAINTIQVDFVNSSVASNVLYALDSNNPEDFILAPDFGNIPSGNHFVSILHTNGCLVNIPFVVPENLELELTVTGIASATISANATGGVQPYTYFFGSAPGSTDNTYTTTQNGTLIVRAVDANGCEVIGVIEINLDFEDIEIPDFFTPNNDGQNDFWRPRNIEPYPNIETSIFDRYGRSIKIMGVLDNGWDGFYNGRPLPAGDYWHIVKLNDGSGREFVGHFTLFR